ncbi:MAG: hypothetical protein K2Y56_23650 [Methylobacterium sp.]|uniref:hypothetical protein n=1 Tax=Methylobacterium sp. TaxID=409 RepID=UPI0025F821C2|nr:hypothetical protein [Methylobacterium sp.]MBX9934473.1 hypothetical protein [Methylobacterium sp.]
MARAARGQDKLGSGGALVRSRESGAWLPTPPWREITTDDYAPRIFPTVPGRSSWIAFCDRLRELLQEQADGQYRPRLVLREAVDYKKAPSQNPAWWWDYDHGPDLALSVEDIHLERLNGRRYQVDRQATISDAMVAKPVPRMVDGDSSIASIGGSGTSIGSV